jgi:uncharacterized protein GlcG (DUF336 family)
MTGSVTFNRPSITAATAQEVLSAAMAEAERVGLPCSIVVLDESGHRKAMIRMDGAPLIADQVATDKAYTAVGFGMASGDWHGFMKDDPPLAAGAVGGIDRLVVFAGGLPLVHDGRVIGAIGVSGGHHSQDVEIAKAGAGVLGVG